MAGYFRQPELTREALHQGWLHTGDLGYLADGELHVTGRLKEVVIVGGRNFSPEDLESVAASAPGVRAGRVVAVSVPDPATATEQVVIMAETGLSEPAAQEELKHQIRKRLTEAGYPVDRVVLLPPRSIMTTASGKVMRVPSRERFLDGTEHDY
jgi:acyl-CoA synthetase (AMP-forming)/AMP-acid ligase II